MTHALAVSLLCTLLAAEVVAQAPDLIVNGGFELGPGSTIHAPSTAMNGWTVFVGSIDQVHSWQSAEGIRSVDLDGVSAGGLRQVVATIPGTPYDLTFQMCGNPDLPRPRSMRVSAGGASQEFTFDPTGFNYQNMGWEPRAWSFVATSSSTTLEFLSLMPSASTQGVVLDDIQLRDGAIGYVSPFGSGCPGTVGTPVIFANQLPAVGQPMSVAVLQVRANTFGVLFVGNDQAGHPNGLRSLSEIGMPNCTLYANLDHLSVVRTGRFGAFVWGTVLPSQPQLAGALFTMQFFFFDPGANPLGVSSTPGAIGRVGV